WVSLTGRYLWVVEGSLALALPLFIAFGLYRAIFRYSGWTALMAVLRAIMVYAVLFFAIFTAYGFDHIPRTVGVIQPILLLLGVGASRAFASYWLGGSYQNLLRRNALPGALIYGAGDAGRQLADALAHSMEIRVLGFIDDAPHLHNHSLNGLTIYAPAELSGLVATLGIQTVLLALPSISRKRRNEILQQVMRHHISVRTLPSVSDLAHGRVSVADIHELDIEDLLGRDPVAPDPALLRHHITAKVILVTGAGGSIGSELCRQILVLEPGVLLLLEQSEFALYAVHHELEARSEAGTRLIPLLGSVTDRDRLDAILSAWQPHTIYHAAAYKHVPLVEHNPAEGLSNNVFGTYEVALAALRHAVANMVLISTDKAVRPTNVMGASKRLAEMILQALAQTQSGTRFSMVRFGNVLGSSGSVVPLFRQQIRTGGPVTVTHAEVVRYFMTIPEAAQLVIQAGVMASSGDVFVLDMGEPVKIFDLARRMIELSGLTVQDEENPEGDIAIEVTGLRPGEKLYEELLIGENPEPTAHPRILKAREDLLSWSQLQDHLRELERAIGNKDPEGMRQLLLKTVSGYVPNEAIVDWIYQKNATPEPGPGRA
ncbi:MAG: polysaccharide biosynthesis protein, partial [Ferrovum sp.]|nr:polysaccharide biosynthesis protein [Ferrovum sp.]